MANFYQLDNENVVFLFNDDFAMINDGKVGNSRFRGALPRKTWSFIHPSKIKDYPESVVVRRITSDTFNIQDYQYRRIFELLDHIVSGYAVINPSLDNFDLVMRVGYGIVEKLFIIEDKGDFEITNYMGHTHLLKGVIIETPVEVIVTSQRKIDVDEEPQGVHDVEYAYVFKGFNMMRTEYSSHETYYCHSHLDETFPYNPEYMCMGASELGELFTNSNQYRYMHDTDFSVYAMYCDTFIRHESIDGGPHHKMAGIYTESSPVVATIRYTDNIGQDTDLSEPSFLVDGKNVNVTVTPYGVSISLDEVKRLMRESGCSREAYYSQRYDPEWYDKDYDFRECGVFHTEYRFRGSTLDINVTDDAYDYDKYARTIFNDVDENQARAYAEYFNEILRSKFTKVKLQLNDERN